MTSHTRSRLLTTALLVYAALLLGCRTSQTSPATAPPPEEHERPFCRISITNSSDHPAQVIVLYPAELEFKNTRPTGTAHVALILPGATWCDTTSPQSSRRTAIFDGPHWAIGYRFIEDRTPEWEEVAISPSRDLHIALQGPGKLRVTVTSGQHPADLSVLSSDIIRKHVSWLQQAATGAPIITRE